MRTTVGVIGCDRELRRGPVTAKSVTPMRSCVREPLHPTAGRGMRSWVCNVCGRRHVFPTT